MKKLTFTVEVSEEICTMLQAHFIGAVDLLDYCANTFTTSSIEEDK